MIEISPIQEKEKSPGLAAFLSFLIWGLGQVYVGRKKTLGIVLILIDIVQAIITIPLISNPGICILGSMIGLVITIFIMLDAYKDAKEYNKEIQMRTKMKSETILSSDGEKILHAPQRFVDEVKQQLKGEENEETLIKTHDEPVKSSTKKKQPKFCSECGNKIEGQPKFCPECGNKL